MTTGKKAQPRTIDLNARREARGAAQKEPVEVHIGDDVFELPAELPAVFLELILDDKLTEAIGSLLDPDQAGRLLRSMTLDDLSGFAEDLAAAYGIEGGLGNLSASGGS